MICEVWRRWVGTVEILVFHSFIVGRVIINSLTPPLSDGSHLSNLTASSQFSSETTCGTQRGLFLSILGAEFVVSRGPHGEAGLLPR